MIGSCRGYVNDRRRKGGSIPRQGRGMPRPLGLAVGALVAGAGIAACGSSSSSSSVTTVSASVLEPQAKSTLNQNYVARRVPLRIQSVSCPNDLDAKVGASEVCTGKFEGRVHIKGVGDSPIVRIKATITSNTAGNVKYDFNIVGFTPSSSPTPSTPTPGTTT